MTYALVRLLAPVMAFTTEEVWGFLPKPAGSPSSVHLAAFPTPEELTAGIDDAWREKLKNWDRLIEIRDVVLKSLDEARQAKFIGAPLEARVVLKADAASFALLNSYSKDLPAMYIVSQVVLENVGGAPLSVSIERAAGVKCERCWKYTNDVGAKPELPTVCAACAGAVTEMLAG